MSVIILILANSWHPAVIIFPCYLDVLEESSKDVHYIKENKLYMYTVFKPDKLLAICHYITNSTHAS